MRLSAESLQQLYRYACSLTMNEAQAYDLVHDALEKFLRNKERNINIHKPDHYLRSMIRNRFIDQCRREKKFPLEDIANVDLSTAQQDFDALENSVIASQTLEFIWPTLSALERELLHLWAIENYTAQEIADTTDSPRGTILSRIHRLRAKIDRILNKPQADQHGGRS